MGPDSPKGPDKSGLWQEGGAGLTCRGSPHAQVPGACKEPILHQCGLFWVKSCAEFVSLSKTRIEQYEKELEKMRNIIPFDQMTIEDLNEVFPETKLDKKKYPYWPHKPIESL
ncbi:ATP synthase subunit d, mitochondrial [Myotis brandtii]|uniref:ATP synthase subunit d, mitochondrial n=1 Tax=Myotis brandtii TaxID=109478 RepID=S7MJT3_MYOBR|nr:ATP synthase subunit d, mitochondrial [Myotis brandtii]